MTPQSTSHLQPSHNAFVGRERELSELRTGLDDASAGRGRLFLLSGEPGIGKTRLAEEISHDASARGMRVMWGRCWEGEGAPAHWPFIQILRACIDDRDGEHLKALLGSGASEIARLIPELKLSPPLLEETKATTDAESARFRLFDSVATLLKNVARSEPLLIVIDDLHDADHPSLQMLRFIALAAKGERILILGTYRDVEVRQSPELGKLIGDLIREGRTVSVPRLSQSEVGEFVERSAAKKVDDKLAADLYQATDGNPLFVEGVVRLLAAEGKLERTGFDGSAFKIPDGVRESIRRRLAALSDEANSLLSIASVIGNEFEMRLLERFSGRSPEQMVEQIDEAVRIGVLRAGTPGFARQQFSHALIREVLYDDLAASRRVELHGEIGAAIEVVYKRNLKAHWAQLAYHFRGARVAEKAIDYSIRAGTEAIGVFAHEEAISHWRAALELVQEFGGDRRDFADLHARLSHLMGDVGERAKAIEHLKKALRTYEELGDADRAAEIHLSLGLKLHYFRRPQDIPQAAEHLRRAEAVFSKGPEDTNLSRLYYGIGEVAIRRGSVRDAATAFRRSMEIAERVGNANAWAISAVGLASVLPQTGKVAEALEIEAQVWSKLDTLTTPGHSFGTAALAGGCLMQLWDPRGAQRWWTTELAKPRLGSAQRKELMLYLQHAYLLGGDLPAARSLLMQAPRASTAGILAFYDGEWAQADSILEQGLKRAQSRADNTLFFENALARVRRICGESARATTLLRQALALYSEEPHCQVEMLVRPELALEYLEMGRPEDALAEVSRCSELSAGEDWRGLGGHLARAEAAVAAAASKSDEANAGFESAVTIFQKYALPWEEADTLQHWGRALNASGDHGRANEKLDRAIEIYRRCGAGERWVQRVEAERPSSPARTANVEDTAGARNDAVFCMEGDYWTVAYDGKIARLKDAKGLHYISHLLGHPGEEISALYLATLSAGAAEEGVDAASAEDVARSGVVAGDLGHAGEMLDAQAKADYQRRLTELEDELEEAREFKDEERIATAEDEKEAVIREIRRAVGLGGRDRRAASSTERARSAVTRAIRLALERISEQNRGLGRLLSTTIKTGAVCSYVPDDRFPVSWRL